MNTRPPGLLLCLCYRIFVDLTPLFPLVKTLMTRMGSPGSPRLVSSLTLCVKLLGLAGD